MTTVTFLTEGKRIIGFDAKGHSGYSEEGSDIVCAAASMLAFTLAAAMEEAGLQRAPEIESACGSFRIAVRPREGERARVEAVFAAIGADKEPTTANNAFNYQYGRWNVIIWPYLNKYLTAGTSPWVLLDSKYNKTYGGAVWNDRIQLAVRSTIDENTDANVWRGRSRFNATFNDWRAFAAGGIASGNELP